MPDSTESRASQFTLCKFDVDVMIYSFVAFGHSESMPIIFSYSIKVSNMGKILPLSQFSANTWWILKEATDFYILKDIQLSEILCI